MQQNSKNIYLRQSLVNMSINTKPNERKNKSVGRKIVYSDSQVLAIRALHKFAAHTPQMIADRYDMELSQVKGLLSYNTRCFLEPTRKDVPQF